MDGVLVDNMTVHMAAFAEISRRYGVDVETDRVLSMSGQGNREIFSALFPAEVVRRVGWDGLGAEKEAIYREMYAPHLAAAKGLIPFLDDLKEHGVLIAVGTSACQANMDFVFDGLDIRHYFDAIVNADMVTRTKPDPEIYLLALRELGLPASECLVFEDAVAGVQAAHGAGIKVVALATSQPRQKLELTPGVALTINDFTQVSYELLERITYPEV